RAIADAINDVRVSGVGRDDAEFRGRQRAPVGEVHLAPVAAAADHDRAGILLRSHDSVGILVVGGNVVDLCDGLGVPEAPCLAIIHGNAGALVGADHHAFAVGRIDPEFVVVLAAGRALEGFEGDAAISGAVHGGAYGIDDVRILRVDEDAAAIRALPVADAEVLSRHVLPGGAAVVGAVKSRTVFDVVADDVHALALGVHRDRHCNAAFEGRNLNLGPRPALVGGFVDHGRLGFGLSAAVAGTETEAARALRGGQHDIGIVVGVLQVARAIIICGLQNVVPALAAIAGTIDTSAMVGGIAKRGDEQQVGIGRIDKNAVDLHSVLEADVLPGLTGIGGLPHAVAKAAADGVASAGIND